MSEDAAANATISSQHPSVPQWPLLPRSPWNSQIAYLRTLFRVKKALDLIEQQANHEQDLFPLSFISDATNSNSLTPH